MTEKSPKGLPSAKLVAIAALSGILAGAVALYFKPSGSGNGGEVAAASAIGDCVDAKAGLASLSPLAKGQVAAMTIAPEPRRLQTLAFNGPDGKPLAMENFSGKTLLVNLWATWCGPCREEMPALNALQKEMGGEKFEVVAVNIDTGNDEKPKAFLQETGVHDLAFYRDNTMGIFNATKKEGLAFGLPVTLLIDGKGCLLGSMNGPAAWNSEDAKALINGAMAL